MKTTLTSTADPTATNPEVTGDDLENSRVTRCRPAEDEVVRAAVGPKLGDADWRPPREAGHGVLRQFVSVTRARVWRAVAALHAHMSMLALGLHDEPLDALVRVVAGYSVDRDRVTKRAAAAEALLLVQLLT